MSILLLMDTIKGFSIRVSMKESVIQEKKNKMEIKKKLTENIGCDNVKGVGAMCHYKKSSDTGASEPTSSSNQHCQTTSHTPGINKNMIAIPGTTN